MSETLTRSAALAKALRAAGHTFPYSRRLNDPLAAATDMLNGRNTYLSDGNLRFFGCRVLQCSVLDDGLVLGIVESVKPPHDARQYRSRFFDIFGRVIDGASSKSEESFLTAEAARKDFWKRANALDSAAHTVTALKERAARLSREAADIDDIAAQFDTV